MQVSLRSEMRPDALLFGESQSRILVTVKEEDVPQLEDIARSNGAPCTVLGMTGGERLMITGGPAGQQLIDLVTELWQSWQVLWKSCLVNKLIVRVRDAFYPEDEVTLQPDDKPREACGVFGIFNHPRRPA